MTTGHIDHRPDTVEELITAVTHSDAANERAGHEWQFVVPTKACLRDICERLLAVEAKVAS